MKSITKITATLALATTLTLTACDEKEAAKTTTQPAAAKPAENAGGGTAEIPKANVNVLLWPRMSADKFGCMLEKTFNYKDKRFNCSLKGYENKGDPCNNTDEYYEKGPEIPDNLVKNVHPWLSSIGLEWEGGNLRNVSFIFGRKLTEEQMRKALDLPPQGSPDPDNIMRIGEPNIFGGSTDVSYLDLTGFEHMGAGEVDCGD